MPAVAMEQRSVVVVKEEKSVVEEERLAVEVQVWVVRWVFGTWYGDKEKGRQGDK